MEYTLDSQGRFVAKFNGSILTCTNSSECFPDVGVCILNNTDTFWGLQNMCTCQLFRGYQGPACDASKLSAEATILAAFNLLFTILSFVLFGFGCLLIWRARSRFTFRTFLESFQVTLLFTTVGSLGLSLEFLHESICYFQGYTVCLSIETLDKVAVCVGFFFSLIAMLNISLMWIDIANRLKAFTKKSVSRKIHEPYKYVLFIYYFVAMVTALTLFLLNLEDYSLIVAAPAFVLIIVLYTIGLVKMNEMLGRMPSSFSSRMLKRIRITAAGIIFASIGIVVSTITEVSLSSGPTPITSPDAVAYLFLFAFGQSANIWILYFCSANTKQPRFAEELKEEDEQAKSSKDIVVT